MKAWKKAILLFAVVLLAFPCYARAEDDSNSNQEIVSEQTARDLSSHIVFESPKDNKLLITSYNEPKTYVPYERLNFGWKGDVPGHWLYIQWGDVPQDVRILEQNEAGDLIGETIVPEKYDTILEISPEVKKITVASDRWGMEICRIALFSEGTLPGAFHQWKETPDHLDYLIISTHPDDDVIFMGGVIPIYGVERGYVGTTAYVTTPGRLRVNEAVQGTWTMGSRYYPLFLGFRDIGNGRSGESANKFYPEAVTLAIVRMLREHRPLVVFSHDLGGEYGHWQHKIVAASVVEACRLAGEKSFDPVSVEKDGTWQVQKCYIHLYPENPLVMDVNTPIPSMGNRNAVDIAREAFLKHVSQQNGHHWVQTDKDTHPMSRFGMAYGVVEAGEDAFDNIDPRFLYASLISKDQTDELFPITDPEE